MSQSPLIGRLIQALRVLPGVGPKSAQRMAYHLLERNRDGALELADALTAAVERVGHCSRCRTLSEEEVCNLCTSDQRDPSILCVVESPTDVHAVESSGAYSGLYFVPPRRHRS